MATKYLRGRSWYLQWTEGDHQQRHSVGAVTEAEAEARRLALERRLQGVKPAAGPAFAEWALEYAHWHSNEYPDSYYRVEQILRCHLIPTFGLLAIGTLGRREVEAYKHARTAAGASAGTVSKEIRTLHALLNKAVEWDVIPRNPIHGVRPPRDLNSKPPRWYTTEELVAIYAADTTYRGAWKLLANTGLRRREGLQLDWQNVGREEIRVVSSSGARTKSGHWRLVPVSEGAAEAIDMLGRHEAGPVLPPVTPHSLSRAFDRALMRAELDGSLHCLRHTYCSHLVMASVPLRTVQVLAGHASFATTERYAHLAPGYLKDSVRGLML